MDESSNSTLSRHQDGCQFAPPNTDYGASSFDQHARQTLGFIPGKDGADGDADDGISLANPA